MRKLAIIFALVISALAGAPLLAADNIVVVVNKASKVPKLNLAQVKALYLGESRFAAPGFAVELHDRDRVSPIFKEFYSAIASMSPKQITIHWSRKVFTGEAPPPTRDTGDDAAILGIVKARPDAISYIYEKNVNPSVRVVYSLKEK